jgi:hypothetical protein
MSTLIALGVTAIIAIPTTAFLCRRQIARKKRVGVPTTLLGTFIPAACMILPIYFCERGSEDFARHSGLAIIRVLFFNAIGFCFLPALLTVIFYQTRNKEIHDA